jgi:hypothetical protein
MPYSYNGATQVQSPNFHACWGKVKRKPAGAAFASATSLTNLTTSSNRAIPNAWLKQNN